MPRQGGLQGVYVIGAGAPSGKSERGESNPRHKLGKQLVSLFPSVPVSSLLGGSLHPERKYVKAFHYFFRRELFFVCARFAQDFAQSRRGLAG